MVRYSLCVCLVLSALLFGTDVPKESQNPCLNELIIKVNQQGLKSIRFFQLPKYYWAARKCQKLQNRNNLIAQNERKQIEQDYHESYRLEGCASSCTYLAAVAVLYFYASRAMQKP